MYMIGVDPGAHGAAVLIRCERMGSVVTASVFDGIVTKSQIDYNLLRDRLNDLLAYPGAGDESHVCMERIDPVWIPGKGGGPSSGNASATLVSGLLGGAVRFWAATHKLPITIVPAKVWQAVLGTKAPTRPERKRAELRVARELFPACELRAGAGRLVPHDGIVAALLIAEYGRRQLIGNST